MNKGILYVTHGLQYAKYCLDSVKSIRDLPIAPNNGLFGRLPILVSQIDNRYLVDEFNDLSCPVIKLDIKTDEKMEKFRPLLIMRATVMANNPFDYFMMLHADTIFKSGCIELFKKCDSIIAVQSREPFEIGLKSKQPPLQLRHLLNELKWFFKKTNLHIMPIYDTGMLVLESQTGKMIGMCLLEAYKKIANEDFYVSPALESIFLSAVLSEMKQSIKVLQAGDVYNSRTSLKDMKIYHHKGE